MLIRASLFFTIFFCACHFFISLFKSCPVLLYANLQINRIKDVVSQVVFLFVCECENLRVSAGFVNG